ncbi:hypothetical protein HYZ97_03080 [Candidatus Pacearchaeota archaeon]|nr:hypothetical protein [Candidatus Pacearchaeota archaeon]
MEAWVQREEGLVHAVVNDFTRKRKRYLGLSDSELEAHFSTYSKEGRYELIPRVETLIERHGVRTVVKDYLTNPVHLFE